MLGDHGFAFHTGVYGGAAFFRTATIAANVFHVPFPPGKGSKVADRPDEGADLELSCTRCGLISLFRGSSLGTHGPRGSCLARLLLKAGASSAGRSKAGALERELTASFQTASSII